MSLLNFAALIGPAALVTKEFKLDANPSDGVYVKIVGRKSGLVAWLFTLIGLDNLTELQVHADRVEFRSSSLSGSLLQVMPINTVCLTESGFFKPILYLIAGAIMAFLGLVTAVSDTRNGCAPGLFLIVLGAGLIALYFFRKVLLISVQNFGGARFSITFKRRVIEGVEITEADAQSVINCINTLVLNKS